jgi:hypothetical protein
MCPEKESNLHILSQSERELFTYSIITALSGVLTKVWGVYAQKICYPNLFFMTLAPADTR